MVMHLIANNLLNLETQDYQQLELYHLLNMQYQYEHKEDCDHLNTFNNKNGREKQRAVFNFYKFKVDGMEKHE